MNKDKELDLLGNGGIIKKIIKEGVGTETPKCGCMVFLHYTCKLTDGQVVDSSLDRNEVFQFEIGGGMVLKGFDIAATSMKKGEKCIVTCSPEYGYEGKSSALPPSSVIIFEMEMLDWQGQDLTDEKDGGVRRFIITKSRKRSNPQYAAYVKIHLVGKFENNEFENREIEFVLGEGSDIDIVKGIEIALRKMSKGETSKIIVKPEYAYGDKGNAKKNISPNATLEFIVNLKEFERPPETWKLDDEEQIAQVKLLKQRGDNYIKSEKYKLAISIYKISEKYRTYDSHKEFADIINAINLNKALCFQKIGEYFDAKIIYTDIITNDKNNIKALYRRGQCFMALNEYDKALEDFQKVNKIDPDNKAAINQIAKCKTKLKESQIKEKEMYANMFSKYNVIEKENINDPGQEKIGNDLIDFCGEWTTCDEDNGIISIQII